MSDLSDDSQITHFPHQTLQPNILPSNLFKSSILLPNSPPLKFKHQIPQPTVGVTHFQCSQSCLNQTNLLGDTVGWERGGGGFWERGNMRLMLFKHHHKLVSRYFMVNTCSASPHMSSVRAEFILRQRHSGRISLVKSNGNKVQRPHWLHKS